jgi:hypothetical protein
VRTQKEDEKLPTTVHCTVCARMYLQVHVLNRRIYLQVLLLAFKNFTEKQKQMRFRDQQL